MSIIFGVQKPSGTIAFESEVFQLAEATRRFAPDGQSIKVRGRIGMGFQPYYTHSRSRLEIEPTSNSDGNLISFDGRLDNYADLCAQLGLIGPAIADSQIVLAGFQKWGERCFSRFVGDWALALWSEKEQALYLSRDHAGSRTLYFQKDQDVLRWSTYLETFFVAGTTQCLDHKYVACYLAARPIRDLTPYKGIQAVLPAHSVIIHHDTPTRKLHWQSVARNTIRYRSDRDYEEHFLTLFKQSVERRTGPGAPILAQLSGGMDSTSIVCTSDHVRRSQDPAADLLDTVSYFDDSEPSYNETPYFSAIEAKRGKVGVHIETSFANRTFAPCDPIQGMYLLPGADSSAVTLEYLIEKALKAKSYRVILSGTGGDEVTGGVPIALPELADHLLTGNIGLFARRSIQWCLHDRSPFFKTVIDTLRYIVQLYLNPGALEKPIPPWIAMKLRRLCAGRAKLDVIRRHRFCMAPHAIDNGIAWWSILDSLPHLFPRLSSRPEYRYPFLDRDLVDFLFSIPREQLLRPGRRRSLLRRALVHIVPPVILERRRKAFVLRSPLAALQQHRRELAILLSDSSIADLGFVDPVLLREVLEITGNHTMVPWWQTALRAVTLELWLRSNSTCAEAKYRRLKHITTLPV